MLMLQGQLMGVCGSVGGGKSSLIQAILGRVSWCHRLKIPETLL